MLKKIFQRKEIHRFSISDSAELLKESDWMQAGRADNMYLDLGYLKALETSLPEMDFRYAIAYDKNNQAVLRAYFQLVTIQDFQERFGTWLEDKGPEHIMQKILPNLQVKLLICGNLFVCGEHGFDYTTEISRATAHDLIGELIHRVSSQMESHQKSSLLLIKELYPENDPGMNAFEKDKFHCFHIDSAMILAMSPAWKSLDDYYDCMTSKFRTKAKGIWKRSAAISSASWTADQIVEASDQLDKLHAQVLDKAQFSIHELNAYSFALLKRALVDRFVFKVYQLEDELVGFSAAMIEDEHVDATHVGINYELNQEHGIYQRMLHEFVELAIQHQVKELRFGRTAEEMKSNLGARPVDMRMYIRHRNGVVNHLVKPIVQEIKPSPFRLRNPFKAAYEAEWIH